MYDPYNNVQDVSIGISNLDFVGIKMGDANGNCTECSPPFTGKNDIYVRSAPIDVNLIETGSNEYALSFSQDIDHLEVLLLAITCDAEPKIISSPWLGKQTFRTNYKDGVFYIGYIGMQSNGETLNKNQPFIILQGNCENSISGGKPYNNEMIVDNVVSALKIKKSKQYYYDISPNPNSGIFSVLIQNNDLNFKPIFTLYNSYGQSLLIRPLKSLNSSLNLDLTVGVYIYTISIGDRIRSGKLIIQ